jgi:hypothetical protein
LAKLKAKIHSRFPINDAGPINFFLNMHFVRDRNNKTISIHQHSKIDKLLADLNVNTNQQTKLPADPNIKLTKEMCPTDPSIINEMSKLPYKSVVGRLLYIMITARPDIATAVSAAGRYSHNPGPEHWKALVHILAYLSATRDLALKLDANTQIIDLHAYADSDWGGETDDRRSRTGYAVFMGNALVIWCSKLQVSTSLSSTESEYIALSPTVQDVVWARKLLL